MRLFERTVSAGQLMPDVPAGFWVVGAHRRLTGLVAPVVLGTVTYRTPGGREYSWPVGAGLAVWREAGRLEYAGQGFVTVRVYERPVSAPETLLVTAAVHWWQLPPEVNWYQAPGLGGGTLQLRWFDGEGVALGGITELRGGLAVQPRSRIPAGAATVSAVLVGAPAPQTLAVRLW